MYNQPGESMKRHHEAARLAIVIAMTLTAPALHAIVQDHGHHRGFFIYIGTYGSKTKGIYAYRTDEHMENSVPLGLVAQTRNPFFLVASPDHRYLYATNMGHSFKGQVSGSLSAFAIDKQTGKLRAIDEVASDGCRSRLSLIRQVRQVCARCELHERKCRSVFSAA